jgi:plastocyanin
MLLFGTRSGFKLSLLACLLVLLLGPTGVAQTNSMGSGPSAGPRQAQHGAASPETTELEGCLTTSEGVMPKLTPLHSSKFYRVEPKAGLLDEQPLAFAQNANALVRVTGHLGPSTDIYDPDHAPVFIIDSITNLAPTCKVSEPVAELEKKKAQPQPARTSAAAPATGAPTVDMAGELLVFKPATIKIKAGQTVEWKNSSAEVHTVTADPTHAMNAHDVELPKGVQPFDSGYMNPGTTFKHTFTTPGTYRYVCVLHEEQGMIGEVIVEP